MGESSKSASCWNAYGSPLLGTLRFPPRLEGVWNGLLERLGQRYVAFGVVKGPVERMLREGVAVGSKTSSNGSNAVGVRYTCTLRAAVEGVIGPMSLDSAQDVLVDG